MIRFAGEEYADHQALLGALADEFDEVVRRKLEAAGTGLAFDEDGKAWRVCPGVDVTLERAEDEDEGTARLAALLRSMPGDVRPGPTQDLFDVQAAWLVARGVRR